MTRLRRALGPVAIAWLLCQVTTMAVAPVALWYGSTDSEQADCTCEHGDHVMCPMHHTPARGTSRCLIQSGGESGVAVFGWLLNGGGIVPAPARALAAPASQLVHVLFDITTISLRPAPPEPPPPRA